MNVGSNSVLGFACQNNARTRSLFLISAHVSLRAKSFKTHNRILCNDHHFSQILDYVKFAEIYKSQDLITNPSNTKLFLDWVIQIFKQAHFFPE